MLYVIHLFEERLLNSCFSNCLRTHLHINEKLPATLPESLPELLLLHLSPLIKVTIQLLNGELNTSSIHFGNKPIKNVVHLT